MHDMTAANLRNAFAGESQAYMRYLIYADLAESEALDNVARLMRAIAFAERVHATNHFKALRVEVGPHGTASYGGFGISSTANNLQIAIEGELFESTEMYPVYKASAIFQEEDAAERSFHWAWQAEQTHAALLKLAKDAVEAGRDYDGSVTSVCGVCGHTIAGEAPDRCPICNAPKAHYQVFA
ncbi:MAG: rubrerythrin family protein [Anaerolineae bacterium]